MRFLFLGSCCLVSVLIVPIVGVGAATATPDSETERNYCRALVYQYDRYSSYADGMSADGRIDRMSGEQQCLKGNFAEGLRLLRAAIERLGFAPLERTPKAGP